MSSFGRIFRVQTFGESHGLGVGAVVDGVPPRMKLTAADVQTQLDRRRPGQSALSTGRQEADRAVILSGTEGGVTLGSPVAVLVHNADHRPQDYHAMQDVPRPSHADYTYQLKYGVRSSSGGGRASARETIGRIIGGSIAEKWLREKYGVEIVAWVSQVGPIQADPGLADPQAGLSRQDVDLLGGAVRCPDPATRDRMEQLIREVKTGGDSIGGCVTCVCRGLPAGLGEPSFEKLEALLAFAMLSIPAVKGFEIGSGFQGASMRGSEHNDLFVAAAESPPPRQQQLHQQPRVLRTVSNRSGGCQGGISNGEDLVFRVAFKPPATIGLPQNSADFSGEPVVLEARGRHDPCVVPRAVPIVESMAALVLADLALQQEARAAAGDGLYPPIGCVSRGPPPPVVEAEPGQQPQPPPLGSCGEGPGEEGKIPRAPRVVPVEAAERKDPASSPADPMDGWI